MRESTVKEFKSNGQEWKVQFTMLKPSDSIKFIIYIAKIIGGSSGKVISAFNGQAGSLQDLVKLNENQISLEKLGDAIFGIMERFEDDEFVEKLNLLLSSCDVGGEKLYVDHLIFMQDGLSLLPKIAKEALGVNYKRFLGENSGIFTKITKSLAIMKSTSDSQEKEM